jgi:hypothetical protein
MADLIQIRRDTAANWTSAATVLAQGELGIETDTDKLKVGDGATAWASLAYLIDVGGYLTAASTNTLTNKTISGASNTLSAISPSSVTGTAAILGANTFTGTQNFADNTAQRLNLLDYAEVTNAIGGTGGGTQDIDLTLGNSVTATVDTSANTFTFSNPTATDELCGFTLILTNGGSQTVTWPASVDWPAATAPTLTAAGVDKLVFETVDGGTTWTGNLAGAAYA